MKTTQLADAPWVRSVLESAVAEAARKAVRAGDNPEVWHDLALAKRPARKSADEASEPAPVATIGREGVDGLIDALALVVRHQDLLPRAVADRVMDAIEIAIREVVDLPPRRLRLGQAKFETTRRTGMLARRNGQAREDNPHKPGRGFGEVYYRAWARGWTEEDVRQARAHAPDRFACRTLALRRPHGRVHNVAE